MCKTSEATTPVVQPSYASAKDIDPLTPSSSGTDQSGSQITRTLKKCIPAMVHNSITFGVPLALFHLTRNVGAAALSLPALYLLCSTRIPSLLAPARPPRHGAQAEGHEAGCCPGGRPCRPCGGEGAAR
eukprot:Sspe_Gene.8038::Locus_2732_Transcript_1_1_Confidence_1.000_Length_2139::g.8038::m.8038